MHVMKESIKRAVLRMFPGYVAEHDGFRAERDTLRKTLNSALTERYFSEPEARACLVVDAHLPMFDRDAGSRTVHDYLGLLRELGFEVTFFSEAAFQPAWLPYWTDLHRLGVNVVFGRPDLRPQDLVASHERPFDSILLSRPDTAGRCIDALRQLTDARLLYYGHDLHWLRNQRAFEATGDESFRRASESYQVLEWKVIRTADLVMYPSQAEVDVIHAQHPEIPCVVLPPYMYDTSTPRPRRQRSDLLFVGSEAHPPNVDGLRWFVAEVLPLVWKALPTIRLHVVGMSTTGPVAGLASDRVIIEGRVSQARLEDLLAQCRVSVAPLRYGAGVKGKIVEAMFHGLPIVTTSAGAEGLVDASQVLRVADTAAAFAQDLIDSYGCSDEVLDTIADRARAYVGSHFSRARAATVLRTAMNHAVPRAALRGVPAERI
jgi:glycosyltransferase involved in cell wall biosynthesis